MADAAVSTPADDGYAMPAEWALHERTLMAWPCRLDLWKNNLAQARTDYASTANTIAAFEPVTMVCGSTADATLARAALTAAIDIVQLPINDSWLRDSGPIFLLDATGRRAGVHFGFNSWGHKYHPWDKDAAVGAELIEHVGGPRYDAPFILEGGSVCVDGDGMLLTTESCLLNVNRNPEMSRDRIEDGLRDYLGVREVVWLQEGLAEDRDTDGHIDLVAAFTKPGEVLLQSVPPANVNHVALTRSRERLEAAGLAVVDFPLLPYAEVAAERIACSYLNFYLCNNAVVVPIASAPTDEEALDRIAQVYPGREVVGVPGRVLAYGGGGPHCVTQQIPAANVNSTVE